MGNCIQSIQKRIEENRRLLEQMKDNEADTRIAAAREAVREEISQLETEKEEQLLVQKQQAEDIKLILEEPGLADQEKIDMTDSRYLLLNTVKQKIEDLTTAMAAELKRDLDLSRQANMLRNIRLRRTVAKHTTHIPALALSAQKMLDEAQARQDQLKEDFEDPTSNVDQDEAKQATVSAKQQATEALAKRKVPAASAQAISVPSAAATLKAKQLPAPGRNHQRRSHEALLTA